MSDHDPIGDALRREADRLGGSGHPLDLADVKSRARRIRRRRTAASGLAAAAVLAVAVPAGMALDGRVTGSPQPDPAASPSASPSDGPAPRPAAPREVVLTTQVDTRSGAASIPYLYQGAIHRPDGRPVPVDGEYDEVARLGDAGWVTTGTGEDGASLVSFLDADGKVLDTEPSTGRLATSHDGNVVGYGTPAGALMSVVAGAEPVLVNDPATAPPQVAPVGMVGSCADDPDGDGCTVLYVSAPDGSGHYVTAGGVTGRPGALVTVAGVSPDGSVSGLLSRADDGSCSAVLDSEWKQEWKTCDHTLGRFSPDGEYVLGHPAYLDGAGDPSVAILDAGSGEVLASYRNDSGSQAYLSQAVWETDTTVLATVFEKGTWSLMRMSVDGILSTVSPGALEGGDETTPPLVLSTRP